MNEFDQDWSRKLAAAIENAKNSGRSDVADYLELKAGNDVIRKAGIQVLFDSLIGIAAEANRVNSSIAIEREDPHNFAHRGANIVGAMLRIRQGVRCLSLEAGWTRTPTDGFMRGGALAVALIRHFGMPKNNAELMLMSASEVPEWRIAEDGRPARHFEPGHLREHFRIFLGE